MAPARQPSQLRALAWLSALTLVQGGMGVLLLPLYVAALPPADFGMLAVVNVVGAVFGSGANLKLDGAMRALYFEHADDGDAAHAYLRLTFTAALLAGATTCAAMMALGQPAFRALFANDVSFFPAGALAIATASVNACLAVYFVYLRNRLQLRTLIGWQALIVVGTFGCQALFVLTFQLGLVGVLWGSLAPAALALLLVCVTTPGLIDPRVEWRRLIPSLQYSLPLVAMSMVFILSTRLDRLVLERHFTLDVLGAYSLLLGVLSIPTIVLTALDGAIRPHLFAEMKAQGERALRAIEEYQRLFCVAGLMSLSVAVFVGTQIAVVTNEPGYLAMLSWLPLGATALVPSILARYYSLLHESQRRSRSLAASVAARLALSFGLLIVLVPRFGISGALGALLAAESLTAVLLRQSAVRHLERPPSLRLVALAVCLFLAALWATARVAENSAAAFGTLQLCLVMALLAVTNRHTLGMLGRAAHAAPAAEPGT